MERRLALGSCLFAVAVRLLSAAAIEKRLRELCERHVVQGHNSARERERGRESERVRETDREREREKERDKMITAATTEGMDMLMERTQERNEEIGKGIDARE